MISAIIVAYNEEEWIDSIISELAKQDHPDYEIILADGGSEDETTRIAEDKKIRIISCRKGRSCQINDASSKARGDILFFVHAVMKFSSDLLSAIQKNIDQGYDGGGFANVFDEQNEKIKRIGRIMNFRFFDKREQSDQGIFYGDNGIFVKREVFDKLNGFAEIPIMEDFDFSKRLNEIGTTVKITDPKIVVSARRHLKSGFWKTRFQWVSIRLLYKLGVSPKILTLLYSEVR